MNLWSINFAVGPGAVHAEFMEGGVILENGAEQAKIRAEFAILFGTENVECLGGKGGRAQGRGCALGRREQYYGFDPVVARATEAEERLPMRRRRLTWPGT